MDANSRACATFGYTREEFRQLDVGSLGTGEPPYTHQDAMGIIARAAAGEELRIEWLGKSKDGRLRWHEVFVRRVTIGGQDRVLALARDITRRKAAEAALRASEEQYRSMFNASTDGLALWNAAGDIVDGPGMVVQAVGSGRKVANAIDQDDPGIWILFAGTAGVRLRERPRWRELRSRLGLLI